LDFVKEQRGKIAAVAVWNYYL